MDTNRAARGGDGAGNGLACEEDDIGLQVVGRLMRYVLVVVERSTQSQITRGLELDVFPIRLLMELTNESTFRFCVHQPRPGELGAGVGGVLLNEIFIFAEVLHDVNAASNYDRSISIMRCTVKL